MVFQMTGLGLGLVMVMDLGIGSGFRFGNEEGAGSIVDA